MNALLLAVALASGLYGQPDSKADEKEPRYSGSGITFTYPQGWKVKAEDQKGLSAITVSRDPVTFAMIQVYGPGVQPKLIEDATAKGFRKALGDKLVKGSDKAVARKVLGADRKGQAMEFQVAKEARVRVEVFAFAAPSRKKVVAITMMSNTLVGGDAGKAFAQVLSSLKEQPDKKEAEKKDR